MSNTVLQNVIRLINDDIIYIEKHGQQTTRSLMQLKTEVVRLSAQLRAQGKKVRLLVNATDEAKDMDLLAWKAVYDIWLAVSFDKCATYGSPEEMRENRATVINELNLGSKIVDLATKKEALAWLSD